MMKTPALSRLSKTLSLAALAFALAAMPAQLLAGPAAISPVVESPAPSPFHMLLKLDVSNDYITPRGLHIENQGLVFQPLFLTFTTLYSNPEGLLNDVTLTLGVWSSIHSNESGAQPGHWNEFDPIAGIAFKFAKYWKFEVNYTAFESMTASYPTSQHLELKLSFADGAYTGNKVFSLNPYLAYWQELKNKATVAFNPANSSQSYYFTLGVTPTFDFTKIKFEFPTFINIVGNEFYQKADGTAGGSGVAIFRTGIQATVPLTFVPKEMGFWSVYAGVKYYHLSNPGVLDGNVALGSTARRDRDLVQVHGGVAIFF